MLVVVHPVSNDTLVGKVDNIDTTGFVLNSKYEKDGSDFEDKIRQKKGRQKNS